MKDCTHYSRENRDEAQFCGYCGRPFTINAPQQEERRAERVAWFGVKILALAVLGMILVYPLFVSFFAQEGAARRKLEQRGTPYSVKQFLREVEDGNTEVVEIFLAAGMDADAENFVGETALVGAVKKGHTDVVKALLSHGANPNVEGIGHGTVLMIAAREGHTTIARVLLESGAYMNAKGPLGWTALNLAESHRHADIVQLLTQAGAKE